MLTYISDILIQILPWIILDYRLYVYWINRVNCEYLKHENYISIPNIHIIDSYAIIVLYITLISKIMCMVVIKILCCIRNSLVLYMKLNYGNLLLQRECCFILWSTVITRQQIHLLGGGELMGINKWSYTLGQ